jgi:phage shock protein C
MRFALDQSMLRSVNDLCANVFHNSKMEDPIMSLTDELSKLCELRQSGALSDEEFASAKARLLSAERITQPVAGISLVNALRRSVSDRWIAGVCGGLARSTGLESWVWRLIFAVLLLFGGAGVLIYLLMWFFVPSEPTAIGQLPTRQH